MVGTGSDWSYNESPTVIDNGDSNSDIVITTSNSKKNIKDKINVIMLSVIVTILICGIALAVVVTFYVQDLLSSVTTATTVTTTITTTTSNPCSMNTLRWNTTGVTILNLPNITQVSGIYTANDGTIYVVDEMSNSVVWMLPYNSTTPTIVAGVMKSLGSAANQLNFPQDVYLDSNKNLYVTDYYNYRVQKYVSGSGTGTTIAGTSAKGTALNQFGGLRYFWFDSTETYMYITDYDNSRIMCYPTNSVNGTNGVAVAGNNGGGNLNTQLNYPWGIHSYPSVSNDLYITNAAGHSVIRWTLGATSGTFVAGTPGTVGSSATTLNTPMGIKLDAYLNMYVADYGNHRIQMFCYGNTTGVTVAGTGTAGSSATQLNGPRDITFDNSMNMYVTDFWNKRVQKFYRL